MGDSNHTNAWRCYIYQFAPTEYQQEMEALLDRILHEPRGKDSNIDLDRKAWSQDPRAASVHARFVRLLAAVERNDTPLFLEAAADNVPLTINWQQCAKGMEPEDLFDPSALTAVQQYLVQLGIQGDWRYWEVAWDSDEVFHLILAPTRSHTPQELFVTLPPHLVRWDKTIEKIVPA